MNRPWVVHGFDHHSSNIANTCCDLSPNHDVREGKNYQSSRMVQHHISPLQPNDDGPTAAPQLAACSWLLANGCSSTAPEEIGSTASGTSSPVILMLVNTTSTPLLWYMMRADVKLEAGVQIECDPGCTSRSQHQSARQPAQ